MIQGNPIFEDKPGHFVWTLYMYWIEFEWYLDLFTIFFYFEAISVKHKQYVLRVFNFNIICDSFIRKHGHFDTWHHNIRTCSDNRGLTVVNVLTRAHSGLDNSPKQRKILCILSQNWIVENKVIQLKSITVSDVWQFFVMLLIFECMYIELKLN